MRMQRRSVNPCAISRVAAVGLLSITKTSTPSANSSASDRREAAIHCSPQYDGMITVNHGVAAVPRELIANAVIDCGVISALTATKYALARTVDYEASEPYRHAQLHIPAFSREVMRRPTPYTMPSRH
jgi:hypothetical protein